MGRDVGGMLLGLEALPDTAGPGVRGRLMPLDASAWHALDAVRRKWSSRWNERKLLAGNDDGGMAVAFSPDGTRVLTGSWDKTARLWPVLPSAQALVDAVKASLPRCLTPAQREQFHLGTAAPRWCHTRNLWPYADHGPPEAARSSPPYGPPPLAWDEWLIALPDRSTGWFTGAPSRAAPGPSLPQN